MWWLLKIYRLWISVLILNMMSVGCIELLMSWINHLEKLLIMTSGESASKDQVKEAMEILQMYVINFCFSFRSSLHWKTYI